MSLMVIPSVSWTVYENKPQIYANFSTLFMIIETGSKHKNRQHMQQHMPNQAGAKTGIISRMLRSANKKSR
jgi:hypothetical protein